MNTHFYAEEVQVEEARRYYESRNKPTLIQRIPGKRTMRELSVAMIPARIIFIMAAFAVCAAVGMHLMAKLLSVVGPTWAAAKAATFATTFEAMPLWILIGGAMSQVSARFNIAIDDARAFYARMKGAA